MKKGITTKRGVSGLLAVLMVMSIFLAACGDKGERIKAAKPMIRNPNWNLPG